MMFRLKGFFSLFLVGISLSFSADPSLSQTSPQIARPGTPNYGNSFQPKAGTQTLAYSAVSIKESQTGSSFEFQAQDPIDSGRLDLLNFTVLDMVVLAFKVDYSQIQRAPAWARERRYIVHARAEEEVDAALAALPREKAQEEKRLMLQKVLAERFHLQVSWKESLGPVYALKILKGRAKLNPSGSTVLTQAESSWPTVPPLYQRGDGARGYEFIGHKCSMHDLASMLTSQMRAPVHDETELSGVYDFVLKYKDSTMEDSARDDTWPPLPEAIKDQLGLELVSQKGSVTYLSIDSLSQPTPN